ncbi:hypothetical protein [Salibacterium lacus]|uniref:Uncharacterized protein n=1 Tax=Salibacterium lacus TaxID=1898109 RepID=A0ABW5SYB7_9BACI
MTDEPRYTAEDIAAERRQQAQTRVELLRKYAARIERLEAELAAEQAGSERLKKETRRLFSANERLRAALTAAKGYASAGEENPHSGRIFDEKG